LRKEGLLREVEFGPPSKGRRRLVAVDKRGPLKTLVERHDGPYSTRAATAAGD
jgi:hypothetical protein